MHCCLYELIVAGFAVLVPHTYSYQKVVTTYRIRLVLHSDTENAASFLLVPHVQQYIQQEDQNIWEPSRMALNSNTAVQQS